MGMAQATADASGSPHAQRVGELEALLAGERDERRRLQSELDLRNCALDSASTHFMILDVTGLPWKIVYANRAVATDHGYEPAELPGQDPMILASVEENIEAFRGLGAAVRAGTSSSTELVARRKDGTTFHLGMFLTPVRHNIPGVTYYLAIGADITVRLAQESEQRRLQEQLYSEMQERERMGIELRLAQKLESVGRLAAGNRARNQHADTVHRRQRVVSRVRVSGPRRASSPLRRRPEGAW